MVIFKITEGRQSTLYKIMMFLVQNLCLGYLLIGLTLASTDVIDPINNLTRNYEKKTRPYHNEKPVEVKIQIGIIALGPFDEKEFQYDIEFVLRHWWNDPRLAFHGNSSYNYNGNPADVIWIPDTYIKNSKSSKSHALVTENKRARIYPNGDVYFSMRASAVITCPMKLKLYPMDTQNCFIFLESYAFSGNNLRLSWRKDAVTIDSVSKHVHIPSYKLEEIKTEQIVPSSSSKTEHFIILKCIFKIKRSFKFYFNRIYLPSSFLVILSWSTFYIPHSSLPARITLIVTNFLATIFVMQGAASQVARIAYTTALDIFMITNVVFISLALVELLIVVNIPNKENKDAKAEETEIPLEPQKTSDHINGNNIDDVTMTSSPTSRSCCKRGKQRNKMSQTHFVDTYAKVLFPACYFCFMAVYFGYYAVVAGL